MSESIHEPVLLNEVVDLLKPGPDDRILDGTIGAAGHATALLERAGPLCRLLGLDRDPLAIVAARTSLARFRDRVQLEQASFADADKVLAQHPSFAPVSRILLDLGTSMLTLERSGRGFSFRSAHEPLDMRYDPDAAVPTAADLLATLRENELAELIATNGEEPLARFIAKEIVTRRRAAPLATVADLVTAVHAAYRRRGYQERSRTNPATRTFQALRIAVNDELDTLRRALPKLVELLAPGGRIAVISFHSLEDRIVKTFFRTEAKGCICPPALPECRCGHEARLRLLTRHVVKPTDNEQQHNPRSRSAKLRAAEKRTS